MNKAQIAREAGCSPQTVKRVLDKYKKKTVKEKLSRSIVAAYANGWSVSKQLDKYGRTMSRSNLYYLAGKARKQNELKALRKEAAAIREAEREALKSQNTPQNTPAVKPAAAEKPRHCLNEDYILSLCPRTVA